MYESHYGMKEKPFSLLPDPDFLYLSRKHATALSMLEYSLTGQAGFVVVTGEVGSGKTTLVRRFVRSGDRDTTFGIITNTHEALGNLLNWVLIAFGVRSEQREKSALHEALIEFLVRQFAAGKRTILIVDEAQNLSIETLEELRLLSNINTDKDELLQMVLVGQPELLEKLKRPELRQFAQRISANYHLAPLDYSETRAYIRHRLAVAGGAPALFSEPAIAAVHCCSGGVPRLINSICDMALVYGFAESRQEIDLETVLLVVQHKVEAGLGGLPDIAKIPREAIRHSVQAMVETMARDMRAAGAKESTSDSGPVSIASGEVIDLARIKRQDERPTQASADGAGTATMAMPVQTEAEQEAKVRPTAAQAGSHAAMAARPKSSPVNSVAMPAPARHRTWQRWLGWLG
jgi:type II secretory pathway predicted ATPase ExeA